MNTRISLTAVGLMLLLSTASAGGIGNQISINVHKEAEGNYVTGEVIVAQYADAVVNVEGNDNFVEQNVDLFLNANTLEGNEEQPTIFTQNALIMGNITGNGNSLSQNLLVNAYSNDLANSNMTQKAAQSAGILGNYNDVSQRTFVLSHDNVLTFGDLVQFSALRTSVAGNYNVVDQSAEQQVEYSSLTYSELRQIIETSSPVLGSGNDISQYAKVYANRNSLTANAVKVQRIVEAANALGNDNSANHNLTLTEIDSSFTGGEFVQESKAITDL